MVTKVIHKELFVSRRKTDLGILPSLVIGNEERETFFCITQLIIEALL